MSLWATIRIANLFRCRKARTEFLVRIEAVIGWNGAVPARNVDHVQNLAAEYDLPCRSYPLLPDDSGEPKTFLREFRRRGRPDHSLGGIRPNLREAVEARHSNSARGHGAARVFEAQPGGARTDSRGECGAHRPFAGCRSAKWASRAAVGTASARPCVKASQCGHSPAGTIRREGSSKWKWLPIAASSWPAPMVVREQTLIAVTIEQVRAKLPFPLLGLDADNDSAFIGQTLVDYCRERGTTLPVRTLTEQRLGHERRSTAASEMWAAWWSRRQEGRRCPEVSRIRWQTEFASKLGVSDLQKT